MLAWGWVLPAVAVGCRGALELAESDHPRVLAQQVLEAPNPADSGGYAVRTLFYGSGTDKNRPEYRDSVSMLTPPVDASKLVDLSNFNGEERNRYWGFAPDSFPLNARVWYPDGDGPYPLVLVVHGNHDMKDFSDPGYAYLGRLLASRGFILASVDMNFVNGFINEENDTRGWLLLKHLEQWRRFNEEPESPVHGIVDMGNIALIGHSRGGEAVANAAAFNRLTRYPDDATLEFDFGFDVQSVVSIAPVDGQYLPTGRKVVMEDVNYMVFHGSHDADVTSFHGLRIYDRLELEPGSDRFKTAIYVYRANHGQFNEGWSQNDSGSRSGRILDLRALMSAEDQQRFARIYISAFLETTLKGNDTYLPIFRDHRVIGGWLPATMYVTRFEHGRFRPLARFEEDIDVTTGSAPGVTLSSDGLVSWREGELQLRSSNRSTTSRSQENQAVWLGWNASGSDAEPPAVFDVALPAGLTGRWSVGTGSTLDLALAPTQRIPAPAGGADAAESRPGESTPEPDAERPLDLTVEVEDGRGRTARVPLSDYGPVRRPLEMHLLRRRDLERSRTPQTWDLILQTYSIPVADLGGEAALDLADLRHVRLVFDRAPAGEVVVDDIGFTDLGPAFLEPRLHAVAAGSHVPQR